jgi:molybdopterin/thiamine biosynthesis adenylyltransferase
MANGTEGRDSLTTMEMTRYNIQIALSELGMDGQERLRRSRMAIVGAGGLGCPVSLYLAAVGIGYLRLIDNDEVSLGNLHRQILHTTKNIGKKKVWSAQAALEGINPNVSIDAIDQKINANNVADLTADVDIIVDCCDNFETRYILNSAAMGKQVQFCSASVYKFIGHLSIFSPEMNTPCYRCLFPKEKPAHLIPPNSEIGVWPPLVGIIGCLQANLVLRSLLRLGECNYGKLVVFNALNMTTRLLKFTRRRECPACGVNQPAIISA